jgi:hypothetical protein
MGLVSSGIGLLAFGTLFDRVSSISTKKAIVRGEPIPHAGGIVKSSDVASGPPNCAFWGIASGCDSSGWFTDLSTSRNQGLAGQTGIQRARIQRVTIPAMTVTMTVTKQKRCRRIQTKMKSEHRLRENPAVEHDRIETHTTDLTRCMSTNPIKCP